MSDEAWEDLPEGERRKRLGNPMLLAADPKLPPELIVALYERASEKARQATMQATLRGGITQGSAAVGGATSTLQSRLIKEEEEVSRALAGNPNTPPWLLAQLLGRFPDEFCRNPAASLLLLEQPDFLRSASAAHVNRLLRRREVPAVFLHAAALYMPWPAAREEAALHVMVAGEAGEGWREGAAEALAKWLPLSGNEERVLLVHLLDAGAAPTWLAEKLRATPELAALPQSEESLQLLLTRALPPTPNFSIAALHRCIALMHPSIGKEAVEKFADSYWWPGRFAVAVNPLVADSPLVLTKLAADSNRYVRTAAREYVAAEAAGQHE